MCTFSLNLSETLVDSIRPAFKDDAAISEWMQKQLELAIVSFNSEHSDCQPRKTTLSQRLRGIACAPEGFDYKEELKDRFN